MIIGLTIFSAGSGRLATPLLCVSATNQVKLQERQGHVLPPITCQDNHGLHTNNMLSHKPGPQSRALCGTVCALSIAIVLY